MIVLPEKDVRRPQQQTTKRRSQHAMIGRWQFKQEMEDVQAYVRQVRQPRY